MWCAVLATAVLAVSGVEATTYIAEPVLVTQPAYQGLSFYLYRPYGMPAGWFVTMEGYPVIQNAQGAWVYGYFNGNTLCPSGYVVGVVQPGAVNVTSLGVPGTMPMTAPVPPQPPLPGRPAAVAMPGSPGVVAPAAYIPSWSLDANFVELAKWSHLVDRVAVLHRPRTPIAWKGDAPTVLFAWTGRNWYAIHPSRGESPAQALQRRLYDLVVMTKKNNLVWNDAETPALANQALLWGYLWMGCVTPAQMSGNPADF